MLSIQRPAVFALVAILLRVPLIGASDLKVTIAEGDGAFNNVKRRLGRNIKVEVRDANGAPVPNATVTFVAPAVGASVSFGPSGNKYETKTDANGIAATSQVVPNMFEGRFRIRVMVSSPAGEQSTFLSQSNTAAGGIEDPKNSGRRSRTALLLGLLGGGAAVGVTLAMRGGGGGGAATPPTNLNIGGVSVGGPR